MDDPPPPLDADSRARAHSSREIPAARHDRAGHLRIDCAGLAAMAWAFGLRRLDRRGSPDVLEHEPEPGVACLACRARYIVADRVGRSRNRDVADRQLTSRR